MLILVPGATFTKKGYIQPNGISSGLQINHTLKLYNIDEATNNGAKTSSCRKKRNKNKSLRREKIRIWRKKCSFVAQQISLFLFSLL